MKNEGTGEEERWWADWADFGLGTVPGSDDAIYRGEDLGGEACCVV